MKKIYLVQNTLLSLASVAKVSGLFFIYLFFNTHVHIGRFFSSSLGAMTVLPKSSMTIQNYTFQSEIQ